LLGNPKEELTMTRISQFQKRLFTEYKGDLSLPSRYSYISGIDVQPLVPVDTHQGGVFILGAYPSARFAAISSERDVPVADNCGPFSTERYFDGSRVRTVDSGDELEKAYLRPLGLVRSQCWITDLVRVFLFKAGHIAKYRRLGCEWPQRETRSLFEQFAMEGMHWLEEELRVARPKVVITLGAEVAGILRGEKGSSKRNSLLTGRLSEISLGDIRCPAIHLAHPGIVMRPSTSRNTWPKRHKSEHIPRARKGLESLGLAKRRE
jgi:hypothetical protein